MGGQTQDGEKPIQPCVQALTEWCRENLHHPVTEQHQKLTQKLWGHYGYYGIIGNAHRLQEFREKAKDLAPGCLGDAGQNNAVARVPSAGKALPFSRLVWFTDC